MSMSKKIDIEKENRYGRLTIIKEITPLQYGENTFRMMLCKCDCGTIKEITLSHLRTGSIVSCGCYRLAKQTKHGLRGHSLYSVWKGIKKRCHNEKEKCYEYYGGRGIKVCNEWDIDFRTFYDWALTNGYKKELEIDRIDNNGNYEPKNCHFVTHAENCRNRRKRRTIKN